jgi:hypothetical protein
MSSQGELREMHAYAVGLKCRERILHVMYIARCVHVFPRAILSEQNLEEILSLAILISLSPLSLSHTLNLAVIGDSSLLTRVGSHVRALALSRSNSSSQALSHSLHLTQAPISFCSPFFGPTSPPVNSEA